jgi:hypothetical protein
LNKEEIESTEREGEVLLKGVGKVECLRELGVEEALGA